MKVMTIRDALNAALRSEMQADDTVIMIGEDVAGGAGVAGSQKELGGIFGVTAGLYRDFGRARVIDTPISETAFVGMALGAAATGLKPVVEVMFCDFMGVCFDQILNQTAKLRYMANGRVDLPLVIRTTMGASGGSAAMHSQSLYAMVAAVPGLRVACPSTPADAAGLLRAALKCSDPVILFEHKGLYDEQGEVDDALPPVPLGRARTVRTGRDITLVCVGAMVKRTVEAAEILAAEGIDAEIIDPRTISPLDIEAIDQSVRKTGRLCVVDEGTAFGGFADMVISKTSQRAFDALRAAPFSVTAPHTPVPYARAPEADYVPSVAKIVERLREGCATERA